MAVLTPSPGAWPQPSGGQHPSLVGRYHGGFAFVPFDDPNFAFLDFTEVQPGRPVRLDSSPVLERPILVTRSEEGQHPGATLVKGPAFRAPFPMESIAQQSGIFCPWIDPATRFWFDRLHVIPNSAVNTNVGNLVSDTDTSFEIFNAHRTAQVDITSIVRTNAVGMTITVGKEPPSPQLLIGAYKSHSYTIRAEAETGPPTINASFEWVPVTAGFSSVTVNFTGQRITIFAFEPQRQPLTTFEWLTAIVEAHDGTEQRMAMRDRPRQTIRYRYKLGAIQDGEIYGHTAQAMEHVLFDSMGRLFAVPVWEDRLKLTSDVAINDTVINVGNTALLDIQPGELLILWRDWDDLEAQTIDSVGANTITVSNPFTQAFTVAATDVIPSFVGYVGDDIRQRVSRVDFAEFEMTFHRVNLIDWADSGPSPELPADYAGLPIWPREWGITGNSITRVWRRDIDFSNNALGQIASSFRKATPRRHNSQLVVETAGRSDFTTIRQFLFALRGRQKIFWMPSKTSNFELTATAAAGAGQIRVRQNNYLNFVADRSQFDHFQVVLTNGATYQHQITASADVGTPPNNETDLTITPVTSVEYNTSNVERIEYITRQRLDTDRLVIQPHEVRDHARIQFPIIEVLNET